MRGSKHIFTRAEARMKILQAANRHIVRTSMFRTPTLLGSRRIQWAVCIVRRNKLVDGDVLRAAGYWGTA